MSQLLQEMVLRNTTAFPVVNFKGSSLKIKHAEYIKRTQAAGDSQVGLKKKNKAEVCVKTQS